MSSKSAPSAQSDVASSAAALKADIERTRQSLGETVEAIATKADVKARAQEIGKNLGKATEGLQDPAKDAASTAAAFVRKYPAQIAAAAVALLAGFLARRRRSR
jgi:ElaB/YqjD/DUF883 family membrane-anchored ribosome-binding protein